jgi:hypothetical protein
MATEGLSDQTTYRLIITRRNASEILLSTDLSGRSLPRVEVPSGVRLAEQLVTSVRKDYGLETYCLLCKSLPPSHESPSGERYAVLEALAQNNEAPPATSWISSATAASEAPLAHADQAAISSSLEDLNRSVREPVGGPFARPGWIQELFGWVQDQIKPLGLRLGGGFRQLNASPTFSLVRLETTGAAVWFKATGYPNSHELPVSLFLSRLFPSYVPAILGVHALWNGWLSPEVPGAALNEITDCSAWERVAGDLAGLQIASVGKSAELLEAKCRDLRLPRLVELIDPFLARMDELMAAQEKQSPAPLTGRELALLGDQLRDGCSLLQSLGLPDTLSHLDFNPGNIIVSPDRCVFLDWAEAYVGHPFLTFEYLLEHFRRSHPGKTSQESAARLAYAARWNSLYPFGVISEAMAVTPLITILAYAVCVRGFPDSRPDDDPRLGGFLRALTRRMRLEANAYRERREQCVSL